MTYRKLGRSMSHRKALLRNLVTSLIEHESIITTHAKAKEAQTAAERLITLAKRATPSIPAAKTRAVQHIFKPDQILPKLFGEIADRYATRPGGYTRILKLENRIGDNAPQSILELVNGRRDMRFALTARTIARLETQGQPLDKATEQNVKAILKNRPNGEQELQQEVEKMKEMFYSDVEVQDNLKLVPPIPKQRRPAPINILENPLTTKQD